MLNDDTDDIYNLLVKYGHISAVDFDEQPNLHLDRQEMLAEGLSHFQNYYHLPITGEADNDTLKLLLKPRCGNLDVYTNLNYKHITRKWNFTKIKWGLFQPYHLQSVELFRKAFNVWSEHINLQFQKTYRDINILIGFRSVNHTLIQNPTINCPAKFDCKGGVLAHAEYPSIHKDKVEIHIDIDENWNFTNNNENEVNLLPVIIHEIGHSLGLDHNNRNDSVMYAYYGGVETLSRHNIDNIQRIYGRKSLDKPSISTTISIPTTNRTQTSTTTRTTTRTTTVRPSPSTTTTTTTTIRSTSVSTVNVSHICDVDEKFTAFLIYDKIVYVFFKQWVWLIDLKTKKPIQSEAVNILDWIHPLRGVLDNSDYDYVVSVDSNGLFTFIIKNEIYIIEIKSLTVRYKYRFSETELGLTDASKIRGVVTSNYGLTYIFFDKHYIIQVDEYFYRRKKIIMSADEFFPGIPNNFSGVYKTSDGLLNFFVGDIIIRYNEYLKEVVSSSEKNLSLLGISCPYKSLIDQLKYILSTIISSNITIPAEN
ncbi:matrix metalloproteinase-16-like [Onthophagus taurus]|uniref:matrix metalloproteinase-16-like n=1 Tax=Onthophagus taurus TaxID=166361 RepID=UPI0039BE493F